jgi:hypothetical protein
MGWILASMNANANGWMGGLLVLVLVNEEDTQVPESSLDVFGLLSVANGGGVPSPRIVRT